MGGKDPITDAVSHYEKALDGALHSAEDLAQEYRVELAWLGIAGVIWGLFVVLLHRTPLVAAIYTGLLFILTLAYPVTRRHIGRTLLQSDIRRRWDRAIHHAGFKHKVPLKNFQKVHVGYQAEMRVGKGVAVKDLELRREQLAASMGVRELKVKRHSHNAQLGTVTFVKTDTLEAPVESNGHLHDRLQPSRVANAYSPNNKPPPRTHFVRAKPRVLSEPEGIWSPIPVGVDEEGQLVPLTLPDHNLLLGGVPGSGKSVAISQLVAAAALDPNVHIWLIDWKKVEFLEFEECAERVAHTPAQAIDLCENLVAQMERSYDGLRERKAKTINASLDIPIHCLFVDELAPYTDGMDRAASMKFSSLLVDLVGRGRAAGIVNVVATQKPDGTTVPTKLRDLFVYRWAMRCMTPEASDTILGRGWASRGYSAVDISDDRPGVGFLLSEDRLPIRLRSFFLKDQEIRDLADRAMKGRQ